MGINILGGHHVTTGRQVPFCLFTDPEFARIGLSETEATEQGIAFRLFKIPMAAGSACSQPDGNPRIYQAPCGAHR